MGLSLDLHVLKSGSLVLACRPLIAELEVFKSLLSLVVELDEFEHEGVELSGVFKGQREPPLALHVLIKVFDPAL
jgi:hypothetical protein